MQMEPVANFKSLPPLRAIMDSVKSKVYRTRGYLQEVTLECGHKRKIRGSVCLTRIRCLECPPSVPVRLLRPKRGPYTRNVGTCIAPGCTRLQYKRNLCNACNGAVTRGIRDKNGNMKPRACRKCAKEFIPVFTKTGGGRKWFCSAECQKRSKLDQILDWCRNRRCRSTPAYLRFLPQLESSKPIYSDQRCSVRGCPFPHASMGLCKHHIREAGATFSGLDSNLDYFDLYGDVRRGFPPVLSVLGKREMELPEYVTERKGRYKHDDNRTAAQILEAAIAGYVPRQAAPLARVSVTLAPRTKENVVREKPVNYAVGKGVGGRGFGKRTNIKRSQYAKKKARVQNKTGTKRGAHDDRKLWNRESLSITGKWSRSEVMAG